MVSRKGMELSVNFIVTFILAIVLFGMGLIFARSIMTGGTELTEETYERFDQQIGQLVCSRGESICLSTDSRAIERGKVDVFPVTIKNQFPDEAVFKMAVSLVRAFDSNNDPIPDTEWDIGLLYNEDEFSLDPGDSDTVPVLVSPQKGTTAGKYSFNVNVQSRDPNDPSSVFEYYPDEKPRKFYVEVK